MDEYITKPISLDNFKTVLSEWGDLPENKSDRILQELKMESSDSEIVNLEHLNLFTDGEPEQEKMISEIFLTSSAESIMNIRECIEGTKTQEDWERAVHKLKGSSAQLGAGKLLSVCLRAEETPNSSMEDKKHYLQDMESALDEIRTFFKSRETR